MSVLGISNLVPSDRSKNIVNKNFLTQSSVYEKALIDFESSICAYFTDGNQLNYGECISSMTKLVKSLLENQENLPSTILDRKDQLIETIDGIYQLMFQMHDDLQHLEKLDEGRGQIQGILASRECTYEKVSKEIELYERCLAVERKMFQKLYQTHLPFSPTLYGYEKVNFAGVRFQADLVKKRDKQFSLIDKITRLRRSELEAKKNLEEVRLMKDRLIGQHQAVETDVLNAKQKVLELMQFFHKN